jgi:hypothetical protein
MITELFDPVFRDYARRVGVSESEASAILGGQVVASLLELTADTFTRGWLNKLLQAAVGGVMLWQATSPRLSDRDKKELLVMGSHELTRVIDPTPSDISELAASISQLVNNIKTGNLTAALSSGLRHPSEFQAALEALKAVVTPPPLPRLSAPQIQIQPPAQPPPVAPQPPPMIQKKIY